jgi:hypothetical protein
MCTKSAAWYPEGRHSGWQAYGPLPHAAYRVDGGWLIIVKSRVKKQPIVGHDPGKLHPPPNRYTGVNTGVYNTYVYEIA